MCSVDMQPMLLKHNSPCFQVFLHSPLHIESKHTAPGRLQTLSPRGTFSMCSSITSIIITSRILVEGKWSVRVICMTYRIIICIIIISLGQMLLSYPANTSHTHTRTHTPPSLFRLLLFEGSVVPNRDGVNAPFPGSADDQWPVAGSFN